MHLFDTWNDIPPYFYTNYKYVHYAYKKCNKCNLEVISLWKSHSFAFDTFYFNKIEIYNHISQLDNLPLTCEEFIIKNVIE